MTRALLVGLVLLVGCDGEAPVLPDAGCSEPGMAPDQPVLACPTEVDLGCIDEGGAPLDVDVSAAACDGSEPTVTCTPDRVGPGVAGGRCTAVSASGASAECAFTVRYAIDGPAEIVCEDAVSVACAGARTEVSLPPPGVMASCDGGAIDTPLSDAPAAGFPVGASDVTWTASEAGGASLSCVTAVTVSDDVAPSLTCAPQTVVRVDPSTPVDVSPPSASDLCDEDVDVRFGDLPTTRGAHTLVVTATDESGNEGTCDLDLEVLDVFAPTGFRVLSAELAGDGTTDVTLGWQEGGGADTTDVRVERASAADGPWAELATLPAVAGATTYTDAEAPGPVAYYRVRALADGTEGGVTDVARALALSADEYHLRDQTVPGVSFDTSLFGVVRHPTDLAAGPFPLVLMMHGNHGNCRPMDDGEDECETRAGHECEDGRFTTTPNAHGYVYLQETLAAQGYVTVSVSANALNCRDGFIEERAQLILAHLRRWSRWNGAGGAPFGTAFMGAVDLSRVSLVGHSRGGEAVALAPAELEATPISGVGLASVFGVGPTDYVTPTPSGVPFAVLLPACDGDVATLEGLRQYDRGLDPADPSRRAQVLYLGANHNFFNTEWRFDDNDSLRRACQTSEQVGGAAQRGMLEVVLADWIRANTDGTPVPAYLRAETDTPALVDYWADRDLDLRWSYAGPTRLVVDDFEGPGSPDTNDTGGANTYSGMIAAIECTGGCARNFSHRVGAVRPAWRDDAALMSFSIGDVDASGYEVLSMRFASRIATINDGLSEHELGLRVRDSAGLVAEVPLSSVGRLPHGYTSRFEQEILTTVRVPLSALADAAPGLDLAHLVSIEVGMPIAGGNAEGSVWMSDLELASE